MHRSLWLLTTKLENFHNNLIVKTHIIMITMPVFDCQNHPNVPTNLYQANLTIPLVLIVLFDLYCLHLINVLLRNQSKSLQKNRAKLPQRIYLSYQWTNFINFSIILYLFLNIEKIIIFRVEDPNGA